jgi:hypothetical protein
MPTLLTSPPGFTLHHSTGGPSAALGGPIALLRPPGPVATGGLMTVSGSPTVPPPLGPAAASGPTAALGGLTVPPPPPGYATAGGPTAGGIEVGCQTITLGGPTAQPFAASSSCASSTSAAPRMVPVTSVAPHATTTTTLVPRAAPPYPTPLVVPASQHNSHHPRATREPLVMPLLRQSPPAKALPVAPLVNPHPMTTQAKQGFWLPIDKLTLSATSSSPLCLVPTSICPALTDPSWRHAMEEEFDALITNDTWDLVPHSIGSNVIIDKWIFKHKFNSDGNLEWYKTRWVLRGFT